MDTVCILSAPIVHMASSTSAEPHNHCSQRLVKNRLSSKHKQVELFCSLQRVILNILCKLFIEKQLWPETHCLNADF